MSARTNGREHLFRLGGGEDENEVLGWLLHDLQQRVESLFGDHVRLIHDEHTVTGLRRSVERTIAQFAHVIHAVVSGSVELSDIQRSGATGRQRHAGIAFPTRG